MFLTSMAELKYCIRLQWRHCDVTATCEASLNQAATASEEWPLRRDDDDDVRLTTTTKPVRGQQYSTTTTTSRTTTAWNSLPTSVHDLSESSSFCRQLKTELFCRAWQ